MKKMIEKRKSKKKKNFKLSTTNLKNLFGQSGKESG